MNDIYKLDGSWKRQRHSVMCGTVGRRKEDGKIGG